MEIGPALDSMKRSIKRELTKDLSNLVKGTRMGTPVKQNRQMGLGQIRLIPAAGQFKGGQFALGLLAVPSVINLASRLSENDILIPRANRAAVLGGTAGVTLAVHLLTGGKSFLLGAFVGQIPSALDAVATEVIASAKGVPAIAPPAPDSGVSGVLGQTSEEQELQVLREELESLSGRRNGNGMSSASGSAEGSAEGGLELSRSRQPALMEVR